MKHPFSDWTEEAIIEAATVYLPADGTNWPVVCKDAIDWLNDRAKDNQPDDGDWFKWRACDPVHIASCAADRHSVGYFRGYSIGLIDQQSADFKNGFQAGWCALLFALHKRRMEQYIAKKKLEELGGAG